MQVSEKAQLYAINGIFPVENVLQNIEMRFFPAYIIRRLNGYQFRFKMKFDENDDTLIYPYIYCYPNSTVLGIRYLFRILKKGWIGLPICVSEIEGKHIIKPREGVRGQSISIMDILNEENNLLDENGRLIIEYGIQVESIKEELGIWHFNFLDRLYGSDQSLRKHFFYVPRNQSIICMQNATWYAHKQLLGFHSPCYDTRIPPSERPELKMSFFKSSDARNCYQIAHGVQVQSSVNLDIVKFARCQRLSNVVSYCEQHFIMNSVDLKNEQEILKAFSDAIENKLNRWLAFLLRQYKMPKTVRKSLEIEKMSGESMKWIMNHWLFS